MKRNYKKENTMYNVMVVDDEANILKLMDIWLTRAGFGVITATNGEEALAKLKKEEVDLIVADVMMPVMDGFTLVETLRAEGNSIPVILATAKESIDDKKSGFNCGADDYMVKPIDHEELVLRINAIIKRADIRKEKKIVVGSCTVDYQTLSVYNDKGDREVFSKKEFLILYKLLTYPERIFTKNQLMDEFWGSETDSFSDTVKVHVNRIRNKIAAFPEIDIATVRGFGYRGIRNEQK